MTKSENNKTIIPHQDTGDVEMWMGLTSVRPPENEDDTAPEMKSLRPTSFDDYVGQQALKKNLQVACSAASRRREPVDHVLLHGPPGLGKTSLAKIIAHQLGVGFKGTSGPVIEKPGDLAAILTSLSSRDVLFIDEIHRLPRVVEEVLYPAMEDYQLDILIGQGPSAKSVKIDLKPFTLVGATTRTGLLTSPLRDRFGMVLRLQFYAADELATIVKRSASLLNLEIDEEACYEIGKRSRGTPRIANRLLKRVRDVAQESLVGRVDVTLTQRALEMLDIDPLGLDQMDREILLTIIDKFHGGPVGIETIAASLGEEKATIEDVYEPFLLQAGLLARTKRGREVTTNGYKHLGRTCAPRPQQNLNLFEES